MWNTQFSYPRRQIDIILWHWWRLVTKHATNLLEVLSWDGEVLNSIKDLQGTRRWLIPETRKDISLSLKLAWLENKTRRKTDKQTCSGCLNMTKKQEKDLFCFEDRNSLCSPAVLELTTRLPKIHLALPASLHYHCSADRYLYVVNLGLLNV